MSDRPRFDYEVAEAVARRLHTLFEGLPAEQVQAAFEELIDDYTMAHHGITVMDQVRKVKTANNGRSTCIQPLLKGRAVLISSYGFTVKSESTCKCGRGFLVLDEKNEKDFQKERDDG